MPKFWRFQLELLVAITYQRMLNDLQHWLPGAARRQCCEMPEASAATPTRCKELNA